MKKPLPATLCALVLLVLLAGCSLAGQDDTATIDERRLIGNERIEPLTGIAQPAPDGLNTGDNNEIQLEVGQTLALTDFNATLTFIEKSEDSRCPKNVICVWEGAAKIVLAFARPGQTPEQFEMAGFVGPDGNIYSNQTAPRVVHEAFGLRFTLKLLEPYPELGVEQTDPVTATMAIEAL